MLTRGSFREEALEDARKHHELRVKLKLSEIDRNCRLSDDQKQKLLLAGSRRFGQVSNRVERVRTKDPGREG